MQKAWHVYPRHLSAANLVLQRSATHEHELGRTSIRRDHVPGLEQEIEILLTCQSPDIRHERIAGCHTESLAVGGATKVRGEHVRIHASTPQPRMSHAATVQVLLIDARWAEHAVSLAVKPAEVMPTRLEGPRYAVANCILVVVGVSRGE